MNVSPDVWFKDTLTLIHTHLDNQDKRLEDLAANKLSVSLFRWVMAAVFVVAASVFGLEVANIKISSGVAARIDTRMAETIGRIDTCCEMAEIQIAWVKEHFGAELLSFEKQLERQARHIREVERLYSPEKEKE